MNPNGALPYLRALRDVLWGDLWLAPRGFAYLALGMALAYAVSMWRARRVYARSVANHRVYDHVLSEQELQTVLIQSELDDKLRLEPVEKIRTLVLWVIMFFAMLSVQAYVLAVTEQARIDDYLMYNDIMFYTPRHSNEATYYELVEAFGFLAIALVAVWVGIHWVGDDFGPSIKKRVLNWIVDLVGPVDTDKPNFVLRALAWLRLIDVWRDTPDGVDVEQSWRS